MTRAGWAIGFGVWLCAPALAGAQGGFGAADPSLTELEIPELELGGPVTITLPGGTKPPIGSEDVSFQLNGIDIRGATAFSPQDLAPLFADRLGREVTLADLFGIVDAIERTYRAAGYVLSFAYLPPQETADGVFAIEVVEGYIAAIRYEDIDDADLIADLDARFAGLLDERPARVQTLEAALSGLNNGLGGFAVTGVLQPAKEGRGGSDLVVSGQRKTVTAALQWDNRGSRYVGQERRRAEISVYNLLALGDRFDLNVDVARPAREGYGRGFDYHYPIDGFLPLILHLGASRTDWEPGGGLEFFEVETASTIWEIDLSAELLRTPDARLTATLGLERRKLDTDIIEVQTARDRIGSVYLSGAYQHLGLLGGASSATLTVRRGLPAFANSDAGAPKSRADAESDFTLVSLSAAHRQPLYADLNALIAISGQYAFDPLFSAHEFAVGGESFGRAYDLGEALGDHGVAGSLELRYDFNDLASWLPRLQPYVFIDGGVAWSSFEGDGEPEALASTGLGLRMELPWNLHFGVEYAYAIGEEPDLDYSVAGYDLGRSRLHFKVEKKFEP